MFLFGEMIIFVERKEEIVRQVQIFYDFYAIHKLCILFADFCGNDVKSFMTFAHRKIQIETLYNH